MTTPDDDDWRAHGACVTADPDLFFPLSSAGPGREQEAQAKAVCARCSVRQPCLAFALATHQVHGIWGGTGEQERGLLRRRGQARTPAAGRRRGTAQRRDGGSRKPAAASATHV
jgi:WhiB family transcriptional regulator, redox-sensing transcriptional regulator